MTRVSVLYTEVKHVFLANQSVHSYQSILLVLSFPTESYLYNYHTHNVITLQMRSMPAFVGLEV